MIKKSLFHLPLWAPLILLVLSFTRPTSAVELSIEDTYGAPGENVTVSIIIDDATDLLSADITLMYDPGILTATGAETTSLTLGWVVAHTINWGEISISLASDTALTGGSGALVDVTFSIDEDAEEGETTISISDATLYGSTYQTKVVTTVNGKVIIANLTSTTTTTGDQPCPSEEIFGEYSEEIELLRDFRDNVLSNTPEGQEIIRLYYQLSPVIVKAMEEDEEFKEEVKEIINGILPLIRTEVE